MVKSKKEILSPEQLICPAFYVENGVITHANSLAKARQINEGAKVADFIVCGNEEYAEFSSGRLALTLNICDNLCSAYVYREGKTDIFCLESPFAQPELRAFSLAAQHLREPLSNAILNMNTLIPNAELLSNPTTKEQLSSVSRNLQQMLRILCNMSDSADYGSSSNLETRNAVSVFAEILEKCSCMLERAGVKVEIHLPKEDVFTLLDEKMLNRGILNLLSNAVKFGSDTKKLDIALVHKNNRLYFSVTQENATDNAYPLSVSRYLREPSIEDGRNGIGLGLYLVYKVASAHNGAVLMEKLPNKQLRTTMTIAVRKSDTQVLHSPVRLPYDYAGERDHCLLELSDILPAELYLE